MSATVTYAMPGKRAKALAGEREPRVARLLALAHKFQGMLDRGEVTSMAELARLGRVSRARITQIMDLLLLAPEIQEEVLFGSVELPLREMLPIVQRVAWTEQRATWSALRDVRPAPEDPRRVGGPFETFKKPRGVACLTDPSVSSLPTRASDRVPEWN